MAGPELLVLDEPTVSLDPLTREGLWVAFRNLADAGATLLYFVHHDYPHGEQLFNRIAVAMMAILPMLVMFLVTRVAMLRERSLGTLERLWTTPLHRADLLLGYATAFTATAVGQSLVLCAVAASSP